MAFLREPQVGPLEVVDHFLGCPWVQLAAAAAAEVVAVCPSGVMSLWTPLPEEAEAPSADLGGRLAHSFPLTPSRTSQRAPGTRRHHLALVACTGTCSARTGEEEACQGLATTAGETTMEDKRPVAGTGKKNWAGVVGIKGFGTENISTSGCLPACLPVVLQCRSLKQADLHACSHPGGIGWQLEGSSLFPFFC